MHRQSERRLPGPFRRVASQSTDRATTRAPRGFTLIEIMIVVVILALLSVIVVANVSNLVGVGRAESLAINVGHVRDIVNFRESTAEPPLAPSGYPPSIDVNWFKAGELPKHSWTGRSMVVETVTLAATEYFPAVKTFDPLDAAAPNAWYNVTNGAFCARIVDEGNAALTLELFNMANSSVITDLAQTTR